jgi:hypothetical protein
MTFLMGDRSTAKPVPTQDSRETYGHTYIHAQEEFKPATPLRPTGGTGKIKMYRAIQKEGNTSTCIQQDTERLLLWSRHFATRYSLAAAARNTFPRPLQTNFESFPNNCCISRDCRLNDYFIVNMWKYYLLFELPCIIPGVQRINGIKHGLSLV